MGRFKRDWMVCAIVLAGFIGSGFGGCACIKEYDVPEYIDIGPNETAFMIPLEGDTTKQAKFSSAEQVEQMKVATKRVQIVHRWSQTGRWEAEGKWIPTVRLIRVDRSPVTREWTASKETGTSVKDQAIWAESKDSVGFSTGFSVTATIEEHNAALFLYRYPNRSLDQIMDGEIRARVQSAFSDAAAIYDLSELREKKSDILKSVRDDAIPFFEGRGITITTLGMFGGLTYENPEIQKAIDQVFVSQREAEISKALLNAQEDKNKRIESEAKALANKEIEVARGVAEGKKLVLEVAEAAAKNPVFLEMRKLEVEEARIQKWDGRYPTYMMSVGGSGPDASLLLNVPPAPQQ